MKRLAPIFSLLGMSAVFASGAEVSSISPEQRAFFEQKIRPVLVEQCYDCHSVQAKKVKAGLYLDTRAGWSKGGDSGTPAILPGQPDTSLLIRAVRHESDDLAMPPKKKLADAQIADLVAWVKMGAPDPRDAVLEAKRADKTWWSLQPLAKAEPPSAQELKAQVAKVAKQNKVSRSQASFDATVWMADPIDRFILASLTEKNLLPNPPADRRTLIRRVTYDLLGLPPTPEEVTAFVNDHRPDAYERLVDRLLASPHYGEQWGRHWLDVARFGESTGFERNVIINNAWPYRDYVIRSFNEDKPFDRFVLEQLAGDVIGKNDPAVEVGTTFLVAGAYDNVGNQDPVAQAQIRANTLDDIITATGTTFLGLTVNCARCHNHKFDPIQQADYYRLQSDFAGVNHDSRVLATEVERANYTKAIQPLQARKEQLTKDKEALEKVLLARAAQQPQHVYTRPAPDPGLAEESFATVEARFVRFKMLATSTNPKNGSGAQLDEFEVWTDEATSRNVALAGNGGKATGARGRRAEDFAAAYGPEMVNDGKFGARWLSAYPAELTLTLAKSERINRVSFSNNRGGSAQGPYVTEYEVLVSGDGTNWTKVADSYDRKPANETLANERLMKSVISPEETKQLAELGRDLAKADADIKAVPPLNSIWAGRFAQPKQITYLQRGGDPQKHGEDIQPASLSVLDRVTKPYELAADAPESQRRLALAEWIVSNDNPLTARVLVNRLWHYHFGTGIVDTPSDFGFLGSKPTHPELLDWLARQAQANGWHVKALQRMIVLSQTYRQAGTFHESAAQADKDARYLWRFPPHRLTGEELRDTLLQVTGQLDTRMGGPGFRLYKYLEDNVATYVPLDAPGPETYRRAVYHQNARASVVDLLSDFDQPDNSTSAPRRTSTTTPMQTLTLLNHQFCLDMSKALAERVTKETTPATEKALVQRAFALVFQRPATRTEEKASVTLVHTYGLPAFCRALLNANELLYLD